MTLDQFTALLDRHGSRRDQWPEHQRAAALSLVARDTAAAAALAETERLDAVMARFDPARQIGPDALVRLQNSVLAQIPARRPSRRPLWRAALDHLGTALGAGREWGPRLAASVAGAAMLGLVAGGLLPTGTTQEMSAVELLAMTNAYTPLDAR